MEEASVAGEFPDRSKQRESSEEPTSGSAGPVPGARGESGAGARDPRLAVARDRESTARGGVDTATRVFSRPPLPADEGDADASTPDTAPEAESEPEGAAPAGGGTDGTGSTRLRAAVAAWVASADEGEGKDGSEGAEGAAEKAGLDADADPAPDTDAAAEAPEGDEEPAADAAADAGPDEPSEAADEAPEGADGVSGDVDEDSSEPESAQESESTPGTEPEPRSEADAERESAAKPKPAEGAAEHKSPAEAEGAAEPKLDAGAVTESKSDADASAEPKPDAEGAANSKPDPRVVAESDSDVEGVADSKPKLDAEFEGAAESKPDTEGAADSKAKPGAEPEDTADSKSKPDPRVVAESKSDSDVEGAADSKPKLDAESEGAAEPKPGTEGAVGSKAKPDVAEPKSKSGAEPEGAADSKSKPDADADSDADGGAAPDVAADPAPKPPAPKPPVDQPTAIFKAVRPPAAPPVDQPTTMLKLGDVAAGKAEAAEADVKDGNGESVAERTSKFVALRQLDDPATRKPPSAAALPAAETANPPAAQSPKAPVADATAAIPQVGPERTTQQPLPPLPPLDLLAELTNTPPPPNTAVRTIARRIKIWTPVVVLLAIVFAVVQVLRPLPTPELTLTAEDSYTFDGAAAALPWPSEGQGWMDVNGIGTMGKFGEQTPVAIGSVAKAMTAYIVLKDHPMKSGEEGAKIPVDATAETEGGYNVPGKDESTLPTVKAGDTLTEKQALSAVMIPSANNIARLLARWDAGTEAAFIKKMNDTAKELGMKNTVYTDASGLKETTVSTAEDQVKLGNELVKIPALTDITKLPVWVDPSGEKWDNYNRLVPYNGAIGIKTGTTTAAGGNLLYAATKEVGGETVTVVGAILGQHTVPIIDTVNAVSKTAMIAARDALLSSKILKKGDVVGYVDDGLGGHTPVVLSKDVTAVGWAGMKVELSFAAAEDLPHTAKAGTTVGTLTVGDGSGGAVKVPVQLQTDLVEPGYDKKLTRVG
ncbi:D-alanyl-D-alanine carboxypeptidase [Streptomyces sp. NPDC002156]